MIDYKSHHARLKSSLDDCYNVALRIKHIREKTADLELTWELDHFMDHLLRLRDVIEQTKDLDRAVNACLEWGKIYYKSSNNRGHRQLWANAMGDIGLLDDQEIVRKSQLGPHKF